MEVSSPDRVMFPEAGVTKAELVGYYEQVAEVMFPLVEGRPLTLQRFPRGVHEKGFMQKNAADHFPGSIDRYPVPKADGGETVYPVARLPEHLPYLANQGTVTFHIWNSRVDSVENPDFFVIDLDPEEGASDLARATAASVREVLDEYGLESLPVATGSKGYHVWVRLDGALSWERVAVSARAIAGIAAHRHPEQATLEFLKKNRKGRVFIDWMRNHPGATVVAPYSVRPRPNASVAMPIAWERLDATEPDAWTLDQVAEIVTADVAWPEPVRLPDQAIEADARALGVDLDTQFDRFGRER